MAESLTDFGASLQKQIDDFEAKVQAQCDKMQSMAQSNYDRQQQINKQMQTALLPVQGSSTGATTS